MKVILKIALLLCIFYQMPSCTFENEEDYFTCDSTLIDRDTLVVYYEDLTYIFSGICSQCHNTDNTFRRGIKMDTYENVVASFQTGKPLPAIKHEGRYRMPKNRDKLQECEIQKIAKWVENGMPRMEN